MRPGYYHVSKRYLGPRVELRPRVPSNAAVDEERVTARIGVCEDVDHCLRAITGVHCPDVGYVYRLHGNAQRYNVDLDTPRRRVPDWELTNEVWLTLPAPFRFVFAVAIEFDIREDDYPRWRRLSASEQEALLAVPAESV